MRVASRRERFYGPRPLRGRAWVAKPGQRRGTQDPFPKGSPGSNPGPRIEFLSGGADCDVRTPVVWAASHRECPAQGRQAVTCLFLRDTPMFGCLSSCRSRLFPGHNEERERSGQREAYSQCDERPYGLRAAAPKARADHHEADSKPYDEQSDPEDGQCRQDCERPDEAHVPPSRVPQSVKDI